jgi:hypothetical protein
MKLIIKLMRWNIPASLNIIIDAALPIDLLIESWFISGPTNHESKKVNHNKSNNKKGKTK